MIISEYNHGAAKPLNGVDIKLLCEDIEREIELCSPTYPTLVEVDYVELHYEPIAVEYSACTIHNQKHNRYAEIEIGTNGSYDNILFVIAHELTHALAPVSNNYVKQSLSVEHDERDYEQYANKIAKAVTGCKF